MPEWWPAVVMGWPAIVASAILAITAMGLGKPRLLTLAAAIAIPFAFYLTLSNVLVGPIVMVSYFAAARALRTRRLWLAASLLAPFFAVSALLLYAVLTQSSGGSESRRIEWHSGILRPQP